MGGARRAARPRQNWWRPDLPDYPSPERAVAALKAMQEYAAWRLRPAAIVTRFPVNRRRVERIISRQLRTGRLYIGEAKAKDILRAYDFVVPEGRLVATVDEAMEAAPRSATPGHEDRLARHHPQVRRGRGQAQPEQPAGRGRRFRAHDAPHRPADARTPSSRASTWSAWCPRAGR